MSPPHAAASRARLALIAFAFHAPGLVVLGRARLDAGTVRANALAVGATLAVMGLAAAVTHRAAAVIAVWAVGHFAWSAWLAHRMYTGRAAG